MRVTWTERLQKRFELVDFSAQRIARVPAQDACDIFIQLGLLVTQRHDDGGEDAQDELQAPRLRAQLEGG